MIPVRFGWSSDGKRTKIRGLPSGSVDVCPNRTRVFVTETICALSSRVTVRGAGRTVGTVPACPALPCAARYRGPLPVRGRQAAPADGQGLRGWPLWAGLPACRRPSSRLHAGASCRPFAARHGSVPCRPSVGVLWAFWRPLRGLPAAGLALVLLGASCWAWRAFVTGTKTLPCWYYYTSEQHFVMGVDTFTLSVTYYRSLSSSVG